MTQKPDTQRAVAAAQAVALAHGVSGNDAVVLPGSSNVMVRLRPAPVVARVMTGTAHLHSDVQSWLAGEVAVGAFLGERGLAVSPSDALPPGPHQTDGLWITFWEFVEHDDSRPVPSADELGRALHELHAALAEFPGDLAPLSETRDWLVGIATDDGLRSRVEELTPTVWESALPAQPIHGDASTWNLLVTDSGLLWNDLEDVCVGPVHWDIAGLVEEARDRGESDAYVAELLRVYDGPAVEELEDFIEAHLLYGRIWRAWRIRSGR
jgi:hypothetical protein